VTGNWWEHCQLSPEIRSAKLENTKFENRKTKSEDAEFDAQIRISKFEDLHLFDGTGAQ
jgi:hypothetical protein